MTQPPQQLLRETMHIVTSQMAFTLDEEHPQAEVEVDETPQPPPVEISVDRQFTIIRTQNT